MAQNLNPLMSKICSGSSGWPGSTISLRVKTTANPRRAKKGNVQKAPGPKSPQFASNDNLPAPKMGSPKGFLALSAQNVFPENPGVKTQKGSSPQIFSSLK